MTTYQRTKTLKQADLALFTGDDLRYRHSTNPRVIYTPGVRYVAAAGGAYWLVDAIASYLTPATIAAWARRDSRARWMQFWTLSVGDDQSAVLEARADAPCEPLVRQAIEWTDFPLPEARVWSAWDGEHWTLYLPSEH